MAWAAGLRFDLARTGEASRSGAWRSGVEYGPEAVVVCDGGEHGWMYTDATKTEIALCGQACADFQTAGTLSAGERCPNSGSSG